MEYIATHVRYNPDDVNGQWISYLNWETEEGNYPLIEQPVIVFTTNGVYDAIVQDIDTSENGQSGYYIVYTAGPILESY